MDRIKIAIAFVVAAGFLLTAAGSAAATHTDSQTDTESFDHLLDDLADIDFGDRCDTDDFGGAVDLNTRSSTSASRSSSIDLDEDTVLLAIALGNNGFGRVSFDDIADRDVSVRGSREFTQQADLDREDAFSAIALGVRGGGSSADRLACGSDIENSIDVTLDRQQRVSLDEDDVLVSIALANNGGGGIDFEDIASIDEERTSVVEITRVVDIDRDDALFLLAFG